jgi:hypothetical protein
MPPETTSQAEIVHTLVMNGGGPLWLQLLVWLGGALVVAMTVFNHRRLQPPRRRVGMIALRALLVGLLVLLYYQPALLEERVATHRNVVAVLVDTSSSMGLPASPPQSADPAASAPSPTGETRADRARAWLETHREALAELKADHDVALFGFSGETTDLTAALEGPDTLAAALSPTGPVTSYVAGLRGVRERLRDRDVGAVIVLTDGIDATAEGRRSEPGPELAKALADVKGPVSFLSGAADDGSRDLAVRGLGGSAFAFLLNATAIEASVEVHGYPPGPVEVLLHEDGVPLARETVKTTRGEHRYRVRFEFVPKNLGKHVYTVSIAPRPDEVWTRNNQQSRIIHIVRDKIRVVHIVGQPSWDQRQLRNLLQENPNVDLVSFFILVNPFSRTPLRSSDTSLIPFPAQELFDQELGSFDLVIFHNFNYGPFQTREYLPNIAQYVRDGGAFLMVGGPLAFTAGDYYGTPIVDILPVAIDPARDFDALSAAAPAELDPSPFVARLTDAGRFHPVTRLALDPRENEALWRGLPPISGVNLAAGLQPGAVVLADHPTRTMRQGGALPVVAAREVDKGRSMAVLTPGTWGWAFHGGSPLGEAAAPAATGPADGNEPPAAAAPSPAAAEGEGAEPSPDAHAYARFWDNAIRWLIRDPELDVLKVRAVRESVPVGEAAELIVSAWEADYRPAAAKEIALVVKRREALAAPAPAGDPAAAPAPAEVVVHEARLTTDANGEARLKLPVADAGVHVVEVVATFAGGREVRARDLFIGAETVPELERVIADPSLIIAAAGQTGGVVLPADASLADVPIRAPTVMRVRNRAFVELWSSGWVLLALAGLFGLEWWLRRRYGYL